MTKCAVLLLTYNGASILSQCIDSIVSQTAKPDIYVIDNGSTDTTAEILKKYPCVHTVAYPENCSFTEAYNKVYRSTACHYEYTLLLSNDVSLTHPSTLSHLLDLLQNEANLGAVAPASRRPDGSFDFIAKPRLTLLDLLYTYIIPSSIRPFSSKYPDVGTSLMSMVLQDSCILIRNKALPESHIFNTKLRFYYTEDDLGHTIRAKGYALLYTAQSSVDHMVSMSTEKKDFARYFILSYLDYLSYIRLYHPRFYLLFLLVTPPFFLLKLLRLWIQLKSASSHLT